MTDRLHIDVETYSECDLKACGLYKYAEDPTTELLVVCYAVNDGPVHVWAPRESLPKSVVIGLQARMDQGANWHIGVEVPADLRYWIANGGEVRAHNAQFERIILNGVAGQKVNFPKLQIGQMTCTAAKAAAAGLPRDLDSAAKARGTYPKKAEGKNDMLACAKPRRNEKEPRWTPENDPERFVRLYDYCIDDVKAERDLDVHTPDLSPNEQLVWEMDQRINDRGVAADLLTNENVKRLILERKAELAKRCREIANANPTQTGQLAEWVRGHGYPQLANLQADTVNRAQKDPKCPPLIRELLLIYSAHNMKAVSKYDAITRAVCKDGRLRGMFLYYGAGTGRWSSLIVQLQNLYRPKIKDCDTAIDAYSLNDLDWIRFLYPHLEPMKVFASTIRGMLIAPPGRDLISLDYAGIESRFTAWMFNEQWKLRVFEAFDAGTGPDSYKSAYARSFGIPISEVNDGMRQIGKVLELAFGFEGGVGACGTAAETYGVDLVMLSEAVWGNIPGDIMERSLWMWDKFGRGSGLNQRVYLGLNSLKEMWRIAHPAHVQGWSDMKNAAIAAVQNPGKVYQIPSKRIMFKVEEDWLLMRLPSGRRIRYFKPEVEGEDRQQVLTYLGVDTETRRWMRTHTYGGKLTENAAQGGSSDLLRHGVRALETAGYEPIMTVHDNGVCEVDEGWGSLEEASAIFTAKPAWADGLPVAAEEYRAKRFRK